MSAHTGGCGRRVGSTAAPARNKGEQMKTNAIIPEIQCPQCGKWCPVGKKCECHDGWARAMIDCRSGKRTEKKEELSRDVKKFIAFVKGVFSD